MDILVPGPNSEQRIPALEFDSDGPKIGSTRLLKKSRVGFVPLPRSDIEGLLAKRLDGAFDAKHLDERLAAIARALNFGDLALAAIATSRLRLRMIPRAELDLGALGKAGPDDPVRPGWPAGTPGGRGGKFRPKDAQAALDPARAAERAARLERLEARRGVRAALRSVLSAKRIGRLLPEGLGEFVPAVDVADSVALVEDLAEVSAEIEEENVEVEAAKTFVEEGPKTLEELTMSEEEESFSSFDAFKKIDLDKRFGPAGDGYEYHHIVEQGADFTEEQLQSTSNIVRIPKLLHEEINAEFAQSNADLGGLSLRQSLQGTSFAAQRAAGLEVLRKIGVLYP